MRKIQYSNNGVMVGWSWWGTSSSVILCLFCSFLGWGDPFLVWPGALVSLCVLVWHKGNENTVGVVLLIHHSWSLIHHSWSHLSFQHSGVVPHSKAPHSAFLSDSMRNSHSLEGAIKAWNFHGRNAQSQLCNDSIKYSDTNQILRSFWCPCQFERGHYSMTVLWCD